MPPFTRKIFNQILHMAENHDLAIIAVLRNQLPEWQRERTRLKAYLEHCDYALLELSLFTGNDEAKLFYVVSNQPNHPDFRETLTRLGRYVQAKCVLIIPKGGVSIHTIRTDDKHAGRIDPIKDDHIDNYFRRVLGDNGRPLIVESLAQTRPIEETLSGMLGKMALHSTMQQIHRDVQAIGITLKENNS